MDERKNVIRGLEHEKKENTGEQNTLLQGLGETLLLRIGDDQPFGESTNEGNAVLAEYRGLLADNERSKDTIVSLEAAIQRFKELDESISGKQGDYFNLQKKLKELHIELGRELLNNDSDYTDESARLQMVNLLAKIEGQENKLEALEDQEGGILAWLGKNAQMAVAKTLIFKNRSDLQRIYRVTGEKFLPGGTVEALDGEAPALAAEVLELRKLFSFLSEELTALREERRKIVDQYGSKGSPSRRIVALEKSIIQNLARLPGVYLRFAALAYASQENDPFVQLIKPDDKPVVDRIKTLKSQIAEKELEIARLKAAITIDNEKAEIDKKKRSIVNQRLKIAAAEEEIADLEKQINELERHIEELNEFLSTSAKNQITDATSGSETPSS